MVVVVCKVLRQSNTEKRERGGMQIGKYYIFVGWRNIYERNQKTYQWYPYQQNRDQFPFCIYVSCIEKWIAQTLRNICMLLFIQIYAYSFMFHVPSSNMIRQTILSRLKASTICTNTYLKIHLFTFYNMSNMTRYI